MCLDVSVCGGCGLDLLGFYQTLKRDAANPASPIALSLAHLKEKMTMMTMMMTQTAHPRHLLKQKHQKNHR
jgi:hypothetical protein